MDNDQQLQAIRIAQTASLSERVAELAAHRPTAQYRDESAWWYDDVNDFRRRQKELELEDIKYLYQTGSTKDLSLSCTLEGVLQLTGSEIDNSNVIFLMTDSAIIANKKRASHIKAWLKKLADREGLPLQLTRDDLVSTEAVGVMFWDFKGLDTDDKHLVKAEPLIPPIPSPKPDIREMEEKIERYTRLASTTAFSSDIFSIWG
jgi:hypothetical protein